MRTLHALHLQPHLHKEVASSLTSTPKGENNAEKCIEENFQKDKRLQTQDECRMYFVHDGDGVEKGWN
jgi:hypothetical protein